MSSRDFDSQMTEARALLYGTRFRVSLWREGVNFADVACRTMRETGNVQQTGAVHPIALQRLLQSTSGRFRPVWCVLDAASVASTSQ